ncbi:MAG: Uncharacterized protein Greene07147_191 [Parcubacteria group bacterium Greene0714_7]|nr:MAG: Uncharacterized protein Greene07147_191 [Parcubacteria group bacterium Greene0714_7]
MKKIFLTLSLLLAFVPSPLLADEGSTPTPAPDPVPITLRVETASATLFNGTITISACTTFPASTIQTVNGFCALEQSGLTTVWTWYGEDAFLDSMSGISNDSSLGNYWTWFANLELGPVALNKHQLVANETLLLSIGTFPLKISISNASPEVNTPTAITVSKFSFDSNFNPIWLPASDSTVYVGPYSVTPNEEGVAMFTATTTDSLAIYATLTNFLPTEHITLTPTPSTALETPTPAPSTSGSGSGGSVLPSKGDADAALAFLLQHQRSDGSFGSAMQNDWVALALSSTNKAQASLNALLPHLLRQNELTNVTDYERHAMVLEALGIDPYAHSDAIQKIISEFDGVQIGDPNLVNDDIFSLFPLMHAGYTKGDEIIVKEVTFILSNQDQNGSWGSVDLTSAAIQALAPLSDVEGVPEAILKARSYLVSRQDSNGCFGNSYSTSWALQAITALGGSPSAWAVWGGSTPLSCMALLQASDGGFGPIEATIENRIWATAYAVPALQGKSWNTILQTFPKQVSTEVTLELSQNTPSTSAHTASAAVGIVAGISTQSSSASISTVTNTPPDREPKLTGVPIITFSNQPTREITSSSPLDAIGRYLVSVLSKVASLFLP